MEASAALRTSDLQRIIESLLLTTDSSRAVLYLPGPGGGSAIVAEAVRHGAQQLRHQPGGADIRDAAMLASLERREDILMEDRVEPSDDGSGAKARMLAPLRQKGRLVGLLALHHLPGPREWQKQDQDAMRRAQADVLALWNRRAETPRDLRAVAVQAVLDALRLALDVQRCTFRQPVEAAYEFPVTFESRAEGVNALLGDFTIVQTGQPVIRKLLAERAQVVQDDCGIASTEPLFHTMLAHYGGMRAQIVTPFIVGDQLRGVLSIHELRDTRVWTEADKALGMQAAQLIGGLFEERR